jgi:hypothetical protein
MNAAAGAIIAARPWWTRVEPAARRVALEGRWLLHAGPPYEPGTSPPAPVLASASLACRHEGWADTDTQALALIGSGAVRLASAQSHRVLTPLAAIVSPSTAVAVVEDASGRAAPTFAPLGTTRGADLRFGTRDAGILERLVRRDGEEAELLSAALFEPLDLLAIADEGVRGGDDLHNRTTGATTALAAALAARFGPSPSAGVASLLQSLAATPLYFLTPWMAAARLMASAAERCVPGSVVTSMGGNGAAFGVQLAGAPGRWFTVPAAPPVGPRLPGTNAVAPVLGALGDSAVIDALGFGGHLLALADESRAALAGFLPDDPGAISARLLLASHPAFVDSGVRVGLDARRIVEHGLSPLVTLAMVEAQGCGGLLGRGVYRPPVELFAKAIAGLDGD